MDPATLFSQATARGSEVMAGVSADQATAGTFMDNLIHTWDLASATEQDTALDPQLVETCIAMFLPDMPERGRASGFVGAEVTVGADASAQDRLLAAMGRQP